MMPARNEAEHAAPALLYEQAGKLDAKSRSSMSKDELISAPQQTSKRQTATQRST